MQQSIRRSFVRHLWWRNPAQLRVAFAVILAASLAQTIPACLRAAESGQLQPPKSSIEAAVTDALQWIAKPAREEVIEALTPAADIRYRQYKRPKPLRVWIARLDVSVPAVRCVVTEPADFAGKDKQFETRCASTLEFARQRGVQLAVNASAFAPFRSQLGLPMDVVGLAAVRGRVYSSADKRFGALYVTRRGRVQLKGPPLDATDPWHIVPGFRMLVDDGKIVVLPSVAGTSFGGPNPRTAAGVDQRGRTLWLVVVDGRQPGKSAGMTLIQLASLFQTLGAWDALNLDGGGSSTLVLENHDRTHSVVNTPVGRGAPGTLRQVATHLGFYLPGVGRAAPDQAKRTLRDTVIRLAVARRGGGYKWAGHGVSKDITYNGQAILKANPLGTYCCGATLETFLDAYCLTRYGTDCAAAEGRWFQNWPTAKFRALQRGWWGTEDAASNPQLPAAARPTIQEKQVYHVLPWTGLAEPVDDYRLLQRGDFVQFWRRTGSGHSVIFWMRDRDPTGRERFWYWSSQGKPRHAYPRVPGGKPIKTPGYGLNWEYLGDDIDPARVYGARLVDAP